ncbi:MAG TPA: 2TM domain-containing protein [Chitinophagaceae bacterium]|jgi:hypothetical protein|nr:2TM domain-containing protein [Chitinophagaceae bacterium]
MEQEQSPPKEKDPALWAIARRRAAFKRGMVTYVVVNIFLWAIWLLTNDHTGRGIPWPVWSTLGWGIAMVIQYFEAYNFSKENAAEKEYEKLKQQQHK